MGRTWGMASSTSSSARGNAPRRVMESRCWPRRSTVRIMVRVYGERDPPSFPAVTHPLPGRDRRADRTGHRRAPPPWTTPTPPERGYSGQKASGEDRNMWARSAWFGAVGVVVLLGACTKPAEPSPTVTVTAGTTASAAVVKKAAAPEPTFTSLSEAFKATSGAVARVEVANCAGYAGGSAFMIEPDLAVTAAHVVQEAKRARLIVGTTASNATVIGYDLARDVALLRTDVPISEDTMTFTEKRVSVGDEVATVGFSLGDSLAFHSGTVNGLDRKVNINGRTHSGLIQHDTAAQPGDSGAPLIDVTGRVVGIQDAGIPSTAGQRLAVDALVAEPLVQDWKAAPAPAPSPNCPDVMTDLDGQPLPTPSFRVELPSSWQTLMIYVAAVNRGDYTTAASQFAGPKDPQILEDGSQTSQITEFTARDMWQQGKDRVIWAEFVTTQDPGFGPADRPTVST
ncbi:MAG: hypothetical protein CSB46_03200 [Micrococcales bacterium]|nr:MAG: hypothetical protein CSB46_03200 [Micrococcales bacterium]